MVSNMELLHLTPYGKKRGFQSGGQQLKGSAGTIISPAMTQSVVHNKVGKIGKIGRIRVTKVSSVSDSIINITSTTSDSLKSVFSNASKSNEIRQALSIRNSSNKLINCVQRNNRVVK